ncbi:GtrA family protein [Vibrio sp. 10N.261.46.E11]|uniref:GtrA family protein n=1 Tax=Vibrio sp. 10N.261.46.E11 TaxID=3229662 RepID=UPI003553CBF9
MKKLILKHRTLIIFCLIGGVNTFIHTLWVMLSVEIVDLNPVIANIVAFFLTNILSYLMNARWAFPSAMHVRGYLKFLLASTGALVMTIALSALAELMGWHYLFGILLVITVSPTVTYFVYKLWVFSRESSSA